LRFSGFEFHVVPQGFLTHIPHPTSNEKRKWFGTYQTKNRLFDRFKAELQLKYAGVSKVPLCAAGSRPS
jgi:hypothetical protein